MADLRFNVNFSLVTPHPNLFHQRREFKLFYGCDPLNCIHPLPTSPIKGRGEKFGESVLSL